MKFTISPDRVQLLITATEAERAELREEADLQSDKALYDAFERLVANSELQWVNPEDTGDLTDAPMLGITGDVGPEVTGPRVLVGSWGTPAVAQYASIDERWAFMDYALRSPLEDLVNRGVVAFFGGPLRVAAHATAP